MANGSGGFSMSLNDALKYGTILLILGGGVARYEMRQNAIDQRLSNIEAVVEARDNLLRRSTAVLERLENERHLPNGMKGVSSGTSSRGGRP